MFRRLLVEADVVVADAEAEFAGVASQLLHVAFSGVIDVLFNASECNSMQHLNPHFKSAKLPHRMRMDHFFLPQQSFLTSTHIRLSRLL